MKEFAIRSKRVVTSDGMRPASVHVRNGMIDRVSDFGDVPPGGVVEAEHAVVMAGLVDTHVHVNDPGRTEWEGFSSATRAAAAGGVTTLFDMPLNSVPATTNTTALRAKRDAAAPHLVVNVGCIGGVVPGNADQLASLHAAGVRLFKCFLVPSGVDEFPCVDEDDLRPALRVLASLNAPLLVHAELQEHIVPTPEGDPRRYATYLASRPVIAERAAIELVVRLAEETGAQVHIVHLSSAESLSVIRTARARGVRITVETCPHYLTFAAAEIPDGATEFKCAPPIRDAATRDALWDALDAGEIDMIVSDHSPCSPELKGTRSGDFLEAWGGIASLQLGLPAVWTEAARRGISIERISEWMSSAPATLAGLGTRKGRLAAGYDADIVIWNPEAPVVVDDLVLYHRHPLTPYRSRTLKGRVSATFVGGVEVYRDGRICDAMSGRLL